MYKKSPCFSVDMKYYQSTVDIAANGVKEMSICPSENLLWGMAWSSWTLSSNVQSYELSLVCYLRYLVRRAWPEENKRIVNRTQTLKEQAEGLSQCNLEDRLGNVGWTRVEEGRTGQRIWGGRGALTNSQWRRESGESQVSRRVCQKGSLWLQKVDLAMLPPSPRFREFSKTWDFE